MNVRLQPLGPANGLTVFEHAGPAVSIGRDPACELSMDGKTVQAVSWRHARIDLHPHGASVTDLGSTNGTYVNDKKIEVQTPLRVGDRIQLGKTGPKYEVVELDVGGKRAPAPRPAPAAPAPAPAPRKAHKHVPAPVDEGPSETRLLLRGVENRQRRLVGMLAVASVLLLVLIGGAVWLVTQSQHRSDRIFRQTLHSLAWVHVYADADKNPSGPAPGAARPNRLQVDRARFTGTGSLIDRKRKWLLTAHHVLDGRKEAQVFFVQFDKEGKEIATQDHYLTKVTPITARVLESDPKLDLAVLELESVPDDVSELPLAVHSPDTGMTVHAVGNPTVALGGVLWGYNQGHVRQVGPQQIEYHGGQKVDARVVMTENPINSGDSGGPLVDDLGELVGVCSGDTSESKVSYFIDIHEIRTILDRITRPTPPTTKP
jgi:S1-C subfamily serine protease